MTDRNPPTRAQIDAIFALAQRYEEVAQEIFAFAQHQLSHDQPAFNEVYKNYLSIMQRAHEMYYSVSHARAATAASGVDIRKIDDATNALQAALSALTNEQKAVDLSLEALAVVGTVAAAIVDPRHVSATAAVGAIGDFAANLGGAGAVRDRR